MVQNLAKDRFGITLHLEKRELPAYTINVGKGGLAGIKMTRSEAQGTNAEAPSRALSPAPAS